jgi:tetratricopeptide (TPR) repeat protein
MIKCPHCSVENPATNRFCGGCGAGLAENVVKVEPPKPTFAPPKPPLVPPHIAAPNAAHLPKALDVPPSATPTVADKTLDIAIPADPLAREREHNRLMTLANVERMRGDLSKSEKTLQTALLFTEGMHERDIAPVHELIGDLKMQRGDLKGARDAYDTAHKLNTERASAERKFAEATLKLAQRDGALAHTEELVKSDTFVNILAGAGPQKRRHAGMAMLFSLFPGFGQLYNGQFMKGAIIMSITALSSFIIAMTGNWPGMVEQFIIAFKPGIHPKGVPFNPVMWVFVFISVGAWLYSLVDAPFFANKRNTEGEIEYKKPMVDKTGWEV